jgi:hypothetical protein
MDDERSDMLESWQDRFHAFLAEYLNDKNLTFTKVATVTSVYQDAGDPFSGCETCGWGALEPSIDISYVDVNGDRASVTIEGSLNSLFGY